MSSLRRRSCGACARAKRRCDLDFPTCRRCLVRGTTCVYPWASSNQFSGTSSPGGPAIYSGVPIVPYDNRSASTDGISGGANADTDSEFMSELPLSFNSTTLVPRPLSPAMMTILDDLITSGRLTLPVDLGLSVAAPTEESGLTLPIPSMSMALSESTGPVVTGSKFQPRTEYAARRIALQAFALAEHGQTSFIHHTQIKSSAVLQDALAASALHAMRNAANDTIVRTEIVRRVSKLVETVEAAIAYSPMIEFDLLPPIQALLIYQCIRLFSTSDVTLQSQAERDEARLLAWVGILQERVHPFGDGGGWLGWVRQESERRAVVFAELLDGVYTFLKLGWDRADVRIAHLGFTAQAALWKARSEPEWSRLWAICPRFEVTISSFGHDIEGSTPDDVDELGIILRATIAGLEALEKWLCADDTTLRKWGLRPGGRGFPAF